MNKLKAGINIDNPIYGTWWQVGSHQRAAAPYNALWREFLRLNPTKEQILEEGRAIMTKFGRGNTLNY